MHLISLVAAEKVKVVKEQTLAQEISDGTTLNQREKNSKNGKELLIGKEFDECFVFEVYSFFMYEKEKYKPIRFLNRL